MHKINIIQVLYDLRFGGSERLAAFIAENINHERFTPVIVGLHGSGPLENELKAKKIHYEYFLKKRYLKRTVLQIKLAKFLIKNKVDIIQVHGSYPLTRVFIPAKMVGAKIIYTEHAKHSLENTPRLKILTRILGRNVDKVVSVSEDLKKYIVSDIKISEYKTEVINNGVDLSDFNYHKKRLSIQGLPEKHDMIFVGIVGRLTDAKDHDNLLKAWRKVCNHWNKFHLIIVGDGEMRETLERQAKKLNLDKNVTFLGQRNDISDIISAMDLMVLSSKREGFPISILEYLAMQKPVIATNVGGIPEIIEHGMNGVLVSPGNAEQLAEKICLFAKNRIKYNEMAILGRKLIEDKYNKNRIIGKYEELYEKIICDPI